MQNAAAAAAVGGGHKTVVSNQAEINAYKAEIIILALKAGAVFIASIALIAGGIAFAVASLTSALIVDGGICFVGGLLIAGCGIGLFVAGLRFVEDINNIKGEIAQLKW